MDLSKEWPEGLRHEMGWFCTERILQLAEELNQPPKPGSWYALSAKKQWIEAKLSNQGLQNVIAMSQRLMQPGEGYNDRSLDETDRHALLHALSDIQEELTLEERAWMEADTAEFLAHDGMIRLLWSTLQSTPPPLPRIIQATWRITQYLYTAHTWKHYRNQNWDQAQHWLQHRLRQALTNLQSWQQEQWSHLLSQYHHQQQRLIILLQQRNIVLHQHETAHHERWEETLFLVES